MQRLLMIVVAVGILAGLATVSGAEPLEAQGSSYRTLSTAATPAQSAESNAMVHATPAPDDDPDCEETRPSNAHPPTMLSRFARTPSSIPDVQCPIPTVDHPFTEQEFHP